jgi:hypothetical protein
VELKYRQLLRGSSTPNEGNGVRVISAHDEHVSIG